MKQKTGHGIETSWETKKDYFMNKTFTEIASEVSQSDDWRAGDINRMTSKRAKIANNIWNLKKLDS